jgi:hypothetical protein
MMVVEADKPEVQQQFSSDPSFQRRLMKYVWTCQVTNWIFWVIAAWVTAISGVFDYPIGLALVIFARIGASWIVGGDNVVVAFFDRAAWITAFLGSLFAGAWAPLFAAIATQVVRSVADKRWAAFASR